MDVFIISQVITFLVFTVVIFVMYEVEMNKQSMLETELGEAKRERETFRDELEELQAEMESMKDKNAKLLEEIEYQTSQLGKIVKAAENIQIEAELPPLVSL